MAPKKIFEIRIVGQVPNTILVLADDEQEARLLVPEPLEIEGVIADPRGVLAVGASRVMGTLEIHNRR